MSFRRLLFVLIALIVSATSVFLGRAWLSPPRVEAEAPQAAPQQSRVLVAQGDLAAGQFIRPENLRWQPWPADGIAQSYTLESKAKIEDFIGAVVRIGVNDGEPITEGRLVRPGDRGFMAAVLTPGYRAVTVTVTVSSGLAGFVFPGDRVDLLLTMALNEEAGAKRQRHASETLLTDLRVLAVDQRADDQSKEVVVAKTATLEVTPKQAETIAVATELGNLSLSLRSLGHNEGGETSHMYSHTWDTDATRLSAPPGSGPPPNTGPAPIKVSVVRGTQMKELEFPRSSQ